MEGNFCRENNNRYVKLHSLWDERDEDYAPVDHATYSGNIWNLFEVSYIADGKENTFSYDARGNRLSEIETYTGSNGRVTDYEYYENSDLIKKAGNWYFNYDKNGNLTARGTEAQDSGNELFSAWTFSETDGELWTYEYDLQNRMTKANYSGKGFANLKERGSYVYDYRGLLVKKTYQNYNSSDLVEVVNDEASKPVTEFYEYTADGRVIYNECSEENNTKKTTYIWANTTLWCEVNEGVVYYHHTDHLGTTEVVTDSSGAIVWEAGYEAFGSVLSERGDSSFTPSYTGKFFDNASGLYYFNARWYDSELGKFTTQDPIRDGLNWWNYCNGNPLIYTDPNGLTTLDDFNYQKRTEDPNKSAENQRKYDHQAREYALRNQGLTDYGRAIHNNEQFFYDFMDKKFDKTNLLNQMDLDRALGYKTTLGTTQSCLLASVFNGYGVMLRNGITGSQILDSIFDEGGNFRKDSDGKSFIKFEKIGEKFAPYVDGSKLWAFSYNMGKILNLTKGDFSKFDQNNNTPAYLNPTNPQPYDKIKNDVSHLKKNGWCGILKQTAINASNLINHFVFVDNLYMYDSLPADRPNIPDYTYTSFIDVYISERK